MDRAKVLRLIQRRIDKTLELGRLTDPEAAPMRLKRLSGVIEGLQAARGIVRRCTRTIRR